MNKKNIGGCVLSTVPDQQKSPNAKMRINAKHYQTLKHFSSLVSLIRHFTKYIFLEQLTAMPQLNMHNMLLSDLNYGSNTFDTIKICSRQG